MIGEAGKTLQQVFKIELAAIGDEMIAQIMRRARKKQSLAALKEIEWPGRLAYQAKILEAISTIAVAAIEGARKEIPKAKSVKLVEKIDSVKFASTTNFDKLPNDLQQKLLKQAQLLVGTQLNDLEQSVMYQYTDSYDTTEDPSVLENDLNGAAMEYIDGQAIPAGANILAAKTVNEARSAFFFDSDVLEEIDAFQFTNGDPVTPICQDLAGTIFAKDDPELFRYTPPLHWNCKSYIEPILSGDLGGRALSPLRPSTSELEDSIQFCEFHKCNH